MRSFVVMGGRGKTKDHTHLNWVELSSLNMKGILREETEDCSMRGMPAREVTITSSCSVWRLTREPSCPGRCPCWETTGRWVGSVGKATGRWLRLRISCSRLFLLKKKVE